MYFGPHVQGCNFGPREQILLIFGSTIIYTFKRFQRTQKKNHFKSFLNRFLFAIFIGKSSRWGFFFQTSWCRTIKLRSSTPTKPTSSFSFPVSDLLYGIIFILFSKNSWIKLFIGLNSCLAGSKKYNFEANLPKFCFFVVKLRRLESILQKRSHIGELLFLPILPPAPLTIPSSVEKL